MSALLEVKGVDKRFGSRPVLRGVSLQVASGEVVSLVGGNGSGKSTLLAICAGVITADAGTIHIGGQPLDRLRRAALRQLGYAPDAPATLPELTAIELCRLVAALRKVPPPGEALLARLGLWDFAETPLGACSVGQRRRALLAAALIGEPPLLILDEPDSGLDAPGVALLADLVAEQRQRGGVLLVTHDPALVDRLATRQLRLVDGVTTTSRG